MTEEAETIRRVLAGDVDSFRLLVERHQQSVFRLAGGLLRDPHACEDVAQETFLSAYRNLRLFDPQRARFATWLLTIARNLCLNAARKKVPIPLGHLPERPVGGTPYDELAEKEWMDHLDRTLEALPPAQRTAFVLAEFLELPYEQIARIERTKVATVRANASKARKRLRSLLRQFSGGCT